MSNTPTTAEVRAVASKAGTPISGVGFDRWLEEQIDQSEKRGYLEGLRMAAHQAANYRGHPAGAAATLAVAFNLAIAMSVEED